jgi:ligand-binding SRPBCC domain-containing protein
MTNAHAVAGNGHQPRDLIALANTSMRPGSSATESLSSARPTTLSQQLRPGSTLLAPWWVLSQTQYVARPIDEVYEFFSNAENLELLTPHFLGFQILSPLPITMRIGARIAYRLRLWGLSLRWLTVIEAWDPPTAFVDLQLRGPYRRWRHLHQFQPTADGGTLMNDRVELQLPLGPLGAIAYVLFVKRTLAEIFRFRAKTLDGLAAFPNFRDPADPRQSGSAS